jgi:hypothetical protein
MDDPTSSDTPDPDATRQSRQFDAGMEMQGKLHIVARSPNDAMSRHRRLRRAFNALSGAVHDGDPEDAQEQVKRCLEAIHELKEDRSWSRRGWNADERDNWDAHIGARDGAHHQSEHVVRLHLAPGGHGGKLYWDLPPEAIRSAGVREAYRERLLNQEVLAPLSALIEWLIPRVAV